MFEAPEEDKPEGVTKKRLKTADDETGATKKSSDLEALKNKFLKKKKEKKN